MFWNYLMKIEKNSSLSLNDLKGALLTNEHGTEFRIYDFYIDLDDVTDVKVSIQSFDDEGNLIEGTTGLSFDSIKTWSIQLQRGF